MSSLSRALLAAAAICYVLLLTACGSSGKSGGSTGATKYSSFLPFSACMRSHGVSNFPDPNPGGGVKITPSSGLDRESPAFQRAQQACRTLLPGGGPPRTVPESLKLQVLNHAECMRAHGVPNYPDPTFPSGGGIESVLPSALDVNSPAFQDAVKACGGKP